MQTLNGIPASNGMAAGPAFVLGQGEIQVDCYHVGDTAAELRRLATALAVAQQEIDALRAKAEQEAGVEEAAIFEAHAMFLDDPALIEEVQGRIEGEAVNAEAAWNTGIEGYAQALAAMDNAYLAARSADLRDVGRRVLRHLLGQSDADLSGLTTPSIILARDLTPSDTVRLDKRYVLGFCTAEGGPTSHTAILAKALAIPAAVGLGTVLLTVAGGAAVLLDGEAGTVVIQPDAATVTQFEQRRGATAVRARAERDASQAAAITRDGHRVEVVANIGSPADAASALAYGAEGVGLFRTEFIFLDRDTAPDEEEQLSAYAAAFDMMGPRPVVVRTIDIGGDKQLPYLDLGREENPFLGWRAIRMCLDRPVFFKTQLAALLRASPGHDIRIMFPMIATLDEIRCAKALVDETRQEVTAAGRAVAETIKVGIMVEIPSAAVMADRLAAHVDFFSIGTNDLTQYTLAADRANPKVAHLGDALHPAVLRLIKQVIDAGHVRGIWTGVCGELAGAPDATAILLGLGLDEFSMAPSSIPRIKAIIRRWSLPEARRLAEQALELDSAEEVHRLVQTWAV